MADFFFRSRCANVGHGVEGSAFLCRCTTSVVHSGGAEAPHLQILVARRNENVGAPTWIRDVMVNIGAGTTRRAAVANGAGMIGVRGEWGVALRGDRSPRSSGQAG